MRERAAAALGVFLLFAGCLGLGGSEDDPGVRDRSGPSGPPPSIGPPLVFGGTLLDAATGEPLANATVRIDLAQVQPCARQGLGWASWDLPYENGRFGPVEVPRPRSDEVAFFVHATAPGYSDNATMIGAAEAAGDIRNLTLVMHEDHAVAGRAPPGTLLALDAPRFPRLAMADANGTFRFERARVVDATLVADTAVPFRVAVAAPADVNVSATGDDGWRVEGTVKGPTGAPLAADIVAYANGSLVSVARSGENGAFSMPLAAEPAKVNIMARTSDGRLGGALVLDLAGPPALRQTILAKALC